MFYYKLEDGSHKPMHPGRRPQGAVKVFLENGTPERLWIKKTETKTVTRTTFVHPDKVEEFDHSPKASDEA